ncbi:MAG: class I SAM-dependent methyltransferase [Bacteroidetes bacterium]|nr:class I SAM-dependent methyltransferase [Bacteroidota bacterium]MDA1019508.1 class I SAM-dependent methyltransferase [Bacteroidota bacterium]
MRKSPIEIFSQWVDEGKDDGMEKNHMNSVKNMLDFVLKDLDDFTFIDAGCGTGWVVRMVSEMKSCFSSNGVDGSIRMIKKARSLDSINKYDCADLMNWKPNSKKDVVHSMEVLYYFEKPIEVLKNIHKNWLNDNGRLIIGVDFYFENKTSHDWPKKTNVSIMTLLTTKQWEKVLINSGFKNIESWTYGESDNWNGTLILSGTKN